MSKAYMQVLAVILGIVVIIFWLSDANADNIHQRTMQNFQHRMDTMELRQQLDRNFDTNLDYQFDANQHYYNTELSRRKAETRRMIEELNPVYRDIVRDAIR